jgi:DNA repair protein RecN (Recombination protein N)
VIEEIRIRGLGVIDDATLPLGAGLTAVSGETGAGKTMVVTGLLLLFGGRAEAARVRSGCEQASVDGRVEIGSDSPAAQRVRGAGGDLDDGTGLVLRRVVSASGRSRAAVGGASAPVTVLGELAEHLLAVHGQADQQRLTRPAQQRAALDRYAGIELGPYAAAYHRWREAEQALFDRTSRMAELRREADLLGHGISEIDAVAPQPGEDVELSALAGRLAHADGLRNSAGTAHDLLLGNAEAPLDDQADVIGLLSTAMRVLGQNSGADPRLDEFASRLTDLLAAAQDLGTELGAYRDGLDSDPERLAAVEQRRAQLIGLTRRYGSGLEPDLSAVLQWHKDATERLADLDISDEAIAALVERRDRARDAVTALAAELVVARADAAERLSREVTAELAGLALPTAEVQVKVQRRPAASAPATLEFDGESVGAGPDGIDVIDFEFRAHPSAPLLALARSASGGELSRVMLALELCLAHSDPVPTMVFDEIDAGVGGRAAVEVGRRLAKLARECQVIVVTHLPQVAAFADRQIVVDRPADPSSSITTSDVHLVEGDDRVAELARMLAGSDSATALHHAAELLADAERARREFAAGRSGAGRSPHKPVKGVKTGK